VVDYLVTSKARRRLLLLLWSEGVAGTAGELAKLGGVGFASAHRELQAMKRLDLVVSERREGSTRFSANWKHPQANVLRELLTAAPTVRGRKEESTREQAAALGAPVMVRHTPKPAADVEKSLVEAAALAHKDPGLARALPVAFYQQREQLDPKLLLLAARERSEKGAVGLFLDLTSELSGDRRFSDWARALRDRRVHCLRPFFHTRSAAIQANTQPDRSPRLAHRWGFRLDMDLDDFRSLFEKSRRAS
jgi:hypothetical protein